MNKPTFEIQEVQFESDKYEDWESITGDAIVQNTQKTDTSEKPISSHTNQLVEDVFKVELEKVIRNSYVIVDSNGKGIDDVIEWLNPALEHIEQECDKKWRLKIEGMKRGVNDEEPFVPFYKPYGMGEEEYASEIHRHEQERAEWQSNCEYNQALDDLLNNK